MNIFCRILAAVAIAGGSLVTAGILPASLGVVFTGVGILGAALHPSVQAMAAFGKSAK